MDITAIQKSGVTVIEVAGSLDSLTSGKAQAFFDGQISQARTRLAVDLSRVEYVSSAGLRVLLSAMKNARQQGGDVYLIGVQEAVSKVLALAGFTSIFKFFPTDGEALAAFPS